MDSERKRILVAVEPPLLADTLADLLRRAGLDDVDVVGPDAAEATLAGGHYDGAVVTITLPKGSGADVVITLPDAEGSAGTGRVATGDGEAEVRIDDAVELIELLDEHVGAPGSRLDAMGLRHRRHG
jgi:DNA-binding response OmpR family regulator